MDASALPPLPLLLLLMLMSGGVLGSECLEDLLPSRNSTRGAIFTSWGSLISENKGVAKVVCCFSGCYVPCNSPRACSPEMN
ncbi:unnamed protein product [Clonostachys rosea f. rosea IK726]|uniref:Uncharacterized protein n=1 Tax=Clonostachys rosea f. rosea IK726 TaxID=1349383 RepID=A0ACA9TJW1_BIOOC|nr:unnamed protein product [Clonostachys rosea f. rosea IK726]